jgi:hypothetical protein
MARASDAVVVGRITSVDPGRVFGELIPELPDPEDGLVRYASMRIAVDEIVAGELPPDDVESLQLEAMVPQFRKHDVSDATLSDGSGNLLLAP